MAERKPFLLRLPPTLWEELQRMAGEDLRSVNGQIEFLLREAVERRRRKVLEADERAEPDSEGA